MTIQPTKEDIPAVDAAIENLAPNTSPITVPDGEQIMIADVSKGYILMGAKGDDVISYGLYGPNPSDLVAAKEEMERIVTGRGGKMAESRDPLMPNSSDQVVILQLDDEEDVASALEETMMQWAAYLRALHLWFHGAHNLAKGTGFAGDHNDLYDMIYNAAATNVDEVLERGVGITQNEIVACPIGITARASEILQHYPSPSNANATSIACIGTALVKGYLLGLQAMYDDLEEKGVLTLGLDDLIMSHANDYEGFSYQLQQRVKTEE